jgi:P63C domain
MDNERDQDGAIDPKAAAKAFSQLGASKGGKARAKNLTPEERSEIARRASETRWTKAKGESPYANAPKATHAGTVQIGGIELPCAVLEGGIRVFTQEGFLQAIGRARKAPGTSRTLTSESEEDQVEHLPAFLSAANLKPFITEELERSSRPIFFKHLTQGGGHRGLAKGYRIELLPLVCNVYLEAKDAGVLTKSRQFGQMRIAKQCDILVRGLATVGIIALVDEATGYQYDRDRRALQEILDRYLRKEFAAWAKRFPDEFYQEIFRLRGWIWKGMRINRPQCVAAFTRDLVYKRLAPGILKELEARNPKVESGYRLALHHQWLTEDIGHPALAQHLHALLGLMRASDTWQQMKKLVNRAFPQRGDSLQMEMFRDDTERVENGQSPIAALEAPSDLPPME